MIDDRRHPPFPSPGGPLKEVLGQFGTKNGWSGPDMRGGPVTEVFNSHTKKEEIRDQRKVVLVPRWSANGGGPHGRFHCILLSLREYLIGYYR